jgi:outer membrane protein
MMLKSRLPICLAGALAFCSLSAPTQALAAPTVTVIVVDPDRILQESKVGKSVQAQIQEKASSYQKNVSQQEQELYSERQEIEKQRSILAQDAFAVKAKEYEQKVAEAGKKAQNAEREIAQGRNQALGRIINSIEEIVQEIAKERNANLVVTKQSVMFFDPSFDVTEETVKRLDKVLPSLTVSFTPVAQSSSAEGGKSASRKKQ